MELPGTWFTTELKAINQHILDHRRTAKRMRQNYMVAVCDVLGFSRLVEKSSLEDVVNGAFGWLRKTLHHSLHKREFPAEIPRKDEFLGNDHIGVAWFSDTILPSLHPAG
jgi:hypothetical protein